MVDAMAESVNTERAQARPDGRSARWNAHRAQRRAELVEAAIAAIEEHGPEVTAGQIATAAGVPRPHLYRHFEDAADLRRAVVERTLGLYQEGMTPVWRPRGTPRQMVRAAIGAHLTWLETRPNLYRYALRAARTTGKGATHVGVAGVPDAIDDTRSGIAAHVTTLVGDFLRAQSLDARVAEPLAYGLVSLVDAAATRWMDEPGGLGRDELADHLTAWAWSVFDTAFAASGLKVDPDTPR
jgi:AcrR family transcriptional regulator